MAKKGKKYLEAAKAVDPTKQYTPEEAVDLLKKSTLLSSMKPLKLLIA